MLSLTEYIVSHDIIIGMAYPLVSYIWSTIRRRATQDNTLMGVFDDGVVHCGVDHASRSAREPERIGVKYNTH